MTSSETGSSIPESLPPEAYRTIFELSADAIFIHDLETGAILDANLKACEMHGCTLEELKRGGLAGISDGNPPYDVPNAVRYVQRAAAGEPQCFKWLARRCDGERMWVEVQLHRVQTGDRDRIAATVRNITERLRAEEALRRSEERFRSLIENAQDLIQIIDPSGKTLYASPSIHRLLGYTPEEMVGRTARDDLHPDDLEATRTKLSAVVASPGAAVAAEYRIRHRDGSWRVFEGYARTVVPDSSDEGIVVNARDITDRKRVEDEMRFQKTLLEAQQETSLDGILVVSATGEIRSYNRRFVDIWGIPPEVLEQRSDDAAIAYVLGQLVDPDEFVARVAQLYGEREATSRDEIELRDGRVFDRYSAPVSGTDGRYYGRVWFFRDITERRSFEEALRKSEQRFRSVVENSSDLVTLLDPEGTILYENSAVERTYGYSERELIGRNALDLVHPEDLPAAQTKLQETVANPGQSRSIEMRIRHKEGHWLDVESVGTTLNPFRAEEGVVVNSRDATERKQAELALRETTRFLENLIASSPGVIFRGSGDRFETTYISPNAEAVLGFSAGEFLAEPQLWVERTDPSQREAVSARIIDAMQRGDAGTTYEYRFLHRDGTYRDLLASVRFERDPNNGSIEVLGYTFDVSPLKEAEAALRQAKEEAENANRAKSEFLSRMSHELRTPMNSILGFAQLLQRAELQPNQSRAVEQIHGAGRHLLNLIDEVLDLARIEVGRQSLSLEPVQAAPLLREAMALIRPLATKVECALIEEFGGLAEVHVRADRQRLTQVVLNLLSNALKYNRAGGEVRVLAEGVPDATGVVAFLRVGVRDTGAGIPPSRMEELFLPFSRLGAEDSDVEGTGLGLAVSKALVEAMGGELSAESEVGVGSTFWVRLPMTASPFDRVRVEPSVRPEGQPDPIASRPVSILYIEDNRANLALIEELFSSYPEITLHSAARGLEGVANAKETLPDLILLDLHLPDLSGEEVLVHLRGDTRTRSIPVVVISADATPRQIERLTARGAREYLTKPIDLDRLVSVLTTALTDEISPRLPGR
jgi:PAS domain S-box-containing protein